MILTEYSVSLKQSFKYYVVIICRSFLWLLYIECTSMNLNDMICFLMKSRCSLQRLCMHIGQICVTLQAFCHLNIELESLSVHLC